MKKILKWTGVAAGAVLVLSVAYIAANSFDCEPLDVAKFENELEVPAESDNVFCELVAATNAISEKTGLPVLASVFKDYDLWEKLRRCKRTKESGAMAEEKDAILAEAAKAISLFRESARRKTWYAFDAATGRREFFPAISAFMRLSELVDLEARRQLELGNVGAAMEVVRDMLELGRKIEWNAESMVLWLVADGGVVGRGFDIAAEIVRSGKATDEELGRLQEIVRSYDLASQPERLLRVFNNELTVVFPQMTVLDDMSREYGMGSGEWVLRTPLGAYAFQRNRTWKTYAQALEKVKACYLSGYDKAALDRLEAELQPIVENASGWRFGPNFLGNKAIVSLFPAWRSILASTARIAFTCVAVDTMAAAERFQRKTGAAPGSLEELVPEFLPAVPADPFAPGTGIKYNPERGVLWTVGANGTFDGEPSKVDVRVYGKYGKENRFYIFKLNGSED